MNKLNATVVIWGNDNYNVLGLLRQLTPYVDEVIFLVNKKTLLCATKSKYCKKHYVAKSIDEGIEYLLAKGPKLANKAFVITSSDLLAEEIDKHRNELTQYYILSTTAEQGLLSKSLNKNYQCSLATNIGIDVPRSTIFRYNTSLVGINYPCLIKPAFKEPGVHHPFKTRICKDENEVREVQGQFDPKGTYIIQQYINKEKDLLVYGCRFEDGRVIYAGSFTKIRWSGGDGSYGIIDSTIPSCIDLGKLNSFLQAIDYRGLFSAEFGVEKGVAWFYEFNLRNDGTSHYFYQAGLTNLPLIWIQYNTIGKRDIVIKQVKAHFIDEIGDIINVKEGLVSKNVWKTQKKEATVFKYYDKADMLPYYYVKLYEFASKLFHRIVGYKNEKSNYQC